MIKKRFIIGILILSLVLMPLILAEDINETSITLTAEQKGRTCLNEKLDEKNCGELNFEEKIYVVLTTGKCLNELILESSEEGCYPKSNCDMISTSKALIALANSESSEVDKTKKWIISQNKSEDIIQWYLQIESTSSGTCKISYDEREFNINIAEDKTISGSTGDCLSISDSLWLRVSPICYEKEFSISCDGAFLTSTFFKASGSPIFHISSNINEDSVGGQTFEKISSYCFVKGTSCNYESTLWATLALASADKNQDYINKFLPYLIAYLDSSRGIISEAFLVFLTGDYKEELLEKQKTSGFWDEQPGNRLFDTAFAISSLSYSKDSIEKSLNWIESNQNEDGCWGGILDTAIVLNYVWPQYTPSSTGPITTKLSCESSGYHCIPSADCIPSELLSSNEYACDSISYKCCKSDVVEQTCEEQGGELCNSDTKQCVGSNIYNYLDSNSYNICCRDGCDEKTQQDPSIESECESFGYDCFSSCDGGYEEVNYDCDSYSQVCCKKKSSNLWLILLLIILIILIILGIVFREKLQPYWDKIKPFFNKIKSKFSKGSATKPLIGKRNFSRMPMQRTNQRTILPPSSQKRPTGPTPSKPKSTSDIDDVLKKLKDMGK